MSNRLNLQSTLENLLGSRNVYYQPPTNIQMKYPAIIYTKSDIYERKADNTKYSQYTRYAITVVDKLPDNAVIENILELPMSSYDRHYVSENLNHDVITLYY